LRRPVICENNPCMNTSTCDAVVWRETPWIWGALIAAAVVVAAMFDDGLLRLLEAWGGQEEYSYGYLIPFITLFLIWQKKDALERIPFTGSWTGVGLCVLGAVLFIAGELSAVYAIVQYAFLVVLAGLALALLGWRGFRVILVPLLILAFMIPLPGFIYGGLSNQLQLISSRIGVWVIQLFGISVHLEGNVIDLGTFKLQVVEACSGLRYLFPLMTFGFILAYFFHAEWWKRAIVFLSTIPITILMNSFRIGVIGVMVEYWGQSMAEGFLHDFEGWAIFMACTAILLGEIWLLARIGRDRRPLSALLNLTFPVPAPRDLPVRYRALPAPYLGALALITLVLGASLLIPQRAEIAPPRSGFAEFPLVFPGWEGRFEPLDPMYIDSLNFDDYIMANYAAPGRELVNFYVGYYAAQNKEKVPHSPRACIPGGGWEITSLTRRTVDPTGAPQVLDALPGPGSVPVNIVVIQKGRDRQLVYYWFQQRGRVVTDEFLVKWYIFWDAITLGRTDGALVRLVTPVPAGDDMEAAHHRLRDFVRLVYPELERFVPGRS
jgi:exosortase D (VPLPA-CTERM-specific)